MRADLSIAQSLADQLEDQELLIGQQAAAVPDFCSDRMRRTKPITAWVFNSDLPVATVRIADTRSWPRMFLRTNPRAPAIRRRAVRRRRSTT